MIRSLGLLTIALGLFALSACNSPGCLVQDKAAEVGANFTASVLECDDVAGIKQELNDDVLSHLGICKAAESGTPQGVLADTLCPVVASSVVDFVKAQGQSFLDRHHCKATAATTLAKDKLTALCKQLPFEPQH